MLKYDQVYLDQVFVMEMCEFHNKQLTSAQSFPPFGELVQVKTSGGVKLQCGNFFAYIVIKFYLLFLQAILSQHSTKLC